MFLEIFYFRAQWFQGQAVPFFGFLNCYLFYHKYFETQYACCRKLQACCRPSRNLTVNVKSNQSKGKMWNKMIKSALLFFVWSYNQNKTDPESFLKGDVTKQEKISLCKKQHFSKLCLEKMKLKIVKNIIFFCYTSYLKILPLGFQEQEKIVHFWSLTVPNQPYIIKSIVWNHCGGGEGVGSYYPVVDTTSSCDMTNFEPSCGLCWHDGLSCFCHILDASVISHKNKLMHTYSNIHKHT